MKEQQISFPSGELTLEGLTAKPDTMDEVRGVVVCHPHPLYGGSMYNNVVDAVLEAIWRQGWATLRFNFRGVGQSQGEHGGGIGEADDAVAALNYLAGQSGISSRGNVLAGYSFGAMAALAAVPKLTDLGVLMLIALPIGRTDADVLEQFSGPILLAAGDNDSYCPAPRLQAIAKDLGSRAQVKIIEGADHFFGGYEQELADALEAMLRGIRNTA
jgi:alpha/beta superfamily hydrolase